MDEIIKELKRRGCFDKEFMAAYGLEHDPGAHKECCQEMERLQQELDEANKRLQEMEAENQALLQKVKDGEEKLSELLDRIEHLDNEIYRNSQNAYKIGKNLEGTLGLVKDISDVQLKNQQLANAVSAINSRDDQKVIDDLRRQLEEELAKLRKCQQDNIKLMEESRERDMELKKLKDLNNKLEAEKAKLNSEKDKLIADLHKDDGKDKLKIGKHTDKTNIEYKDKDLEKNKVDTKNDNKDKKRTYTPERTLDDSAKSKIIRDDDSKKDSNENKKSDRDSTKIPTQSPTRKAAALPEAALQKPKEAAALSDKTKLSTSSAPREVAASPKQKSVKDKAAALDDFVQKKSDIFKFNLQKGRGFQKELRKILEEFIQECGFCFCRLVNPKSKLYVICHKLYHCGINTLSFRELAYLHKKIYARAEELVPGCLLDMILSDNKEQVDNMLSTSIPRLGGGTEIDIKLSDTNITDLDPKCCSCKNELCCSNSDEILKDKVNKLEKDFEIAREYLEALTNIPLDANLTSENDGDSTDTNNDNVTFRATSNMEIVRKSSNTKRFKKIKTRLSTHEDEMMYRFN